MTPKGVPWCPVTLLRRLTLDPLIVAEQVRRGAAAQSARACPESSVGVAGEWGERAVNGEYYEELLLDFANQFPGYGSLKSDLWLIGPEASPEATRPRGCRAKNPDLLR